MARAPTEGRSSSRMRALLQHASDAVILLDDESRFIEANPRACAMLGYSSSELVGRPVVELVHPDDRKDVPSPISRFERRLVRKDGSTFVGEVSMSAPTDGTALGILRDVTGRAESELRWQGEVTRVSALLRMAARLNAQLDLDSVLRTICQELAHSFGVTTAAVRLLDERDDMLHLVASHGVRDEDRAGMPPLPRATCEPIALEHGDVMVTSDAQSLRNLPGSEARTTLALRGAAMVILRREGRLLGSLALGTRERRDFSADEIVLLRGMGDLAVQAIVNARLLEENRRQLGALQALYSGAHSLVANADLEEVAANIARVCVESFGLSLALVGVAADDGSFSVLTHAPARVDYGDRLVVRWDETPEGNGPTGVAIRSGTPQFCNDVEHDPRVAPWRRLAAEYGFRSSAALPLVWRGKPFGALNLYSGELAYFTPQRLDFFSGFADLAAAALESARVHEEARQRAVDLEATIDALRESETNTRAILDATADGILSIAEDGTIVSFNIAASFIFGMLPDEAIGRNIAQLMPECVPPFDELEASKGLRTGEMRVLRRGREVIGVRRDGRKLAVELSVSAARVSHRRMFTVVARDIEDRKRAEEAVRRSEANFRSLIEFSPDGIVVHRDREIIYANPAMLRYLGHTTPGELVGNSILSIVHPDQRAVVAQRIQRIETSAERSSPTEIRFLRKNGSVQLMETAGMLVVFDGRPGIVVVARDLTERKEMEAKLLLSDRMASVGTLAAGVAHEINNPLAYVMANLDFVREDARHSRADPKVRQALEEARRGAERVRDIVRDLKTFSRVDEDQRGATDLRTVLESTLNMAGNEIRHRARLVKSFGDVPLVDANESRLGQLFLNLVVNAIQAIPEGDAEKNAIGVTTRTSANGSAEVEVRDSGCGIAPEIVGRIFDPFFTTKPPGLGTGLGLSICHNIVRTLGGELTVSSTVGQGTVFRVSLPKATSLPRPAPELRPEAPTVRARILVIDDEPMIGTSIQRALLEHDVTACTDARDAIALLAKGGVFDLVCCDLMMPGMSGMDFHAWLQTHAPSLAESTLFLTGGAFTVRAREFLARGAKHLEKPFSIEELRRELARILGARPRAPA